MHKESEDVVAENIRCGSQRVDRYFVNLFAVGARSAPAVLCTNLTIIDGDCVE